MHKRNSSKRNPAGPHVGVTKKALGDLPFLDGKPLPTRTKRATDPPPLHHHLLTWES